MTLETLTQSAKLYFPQLETQYKDQSWLMRLLGKILFFNKKFMTNYTTTIGSTVYFPNADFVKQRPISALVILMHELVHINDAKKMGSLLFSFLYLTPQILALLAIPLLFLMGWKIPLLLFLVLMSPLPSYFRMHFEKRAYMASLYVTNALGKKLGFDPMLDKNEAYYLSQFRNSYYYFMWVFKGLNKEFDVAVVKIKNGERPYDDPVFNILDALIEKV